jgi:predicted Fe-Mo cluster-binding NifX family protein
MKYAVPVSGGRLSSHFGHCEEFAFFDADAEKKIINGKEILPAPEHQPGLLPAWLAGHGVNIVIAGGMGPRALEIFRQNGIDVVLGAMASEPEDAVISHLKGALTTGENVCDH